MADISRYLSGSELYGDDFDQAAIEAWFKAEEAGYHDLMPTDQEYSGTGWSEVYRHHIYSNFSERRFEVALALGCSDGSELLPVADRIGKIIGIEPVRSWWRPMIGNTPAEYRAPEISGKISLPDECIDLAVAFGVLHHIPNVSVVLSELARISRKGGILAIREPNYSMGDWRRPRKGLTANERGIPETWMEQKFEALGLHVLHKSRCAFPPSARLAEKAGIKTPYASKSYVRLDAALSRIFAWNLRYHRPAFWSRFAPTSTCYLLSRA